MSKLTPQQMLAHTSEMKKNIERAKRSVIAVGLPQGTAASKIYGDGTTVVIVGTAHEFGNEKLPQRSFLRVPFKVKNDDIKKALKIAFKGVFEQGKPADLQLEKVGVLLQNISKDAFSNQGYGTWLALKQSTIDQRRLKSDTPLIDTGTLRSSITYEVRNAT